MGYDRGEGRLEVVAWTDGFWVEEENERFFGGSRLKNGKEGVHGPGC
jgi:hypothetical protein